MSRIGRWLDNALDDIVRGFWAGIDWIDDVVTHRRPG